MNIVNKIKLLIENLTGYWIYQKKYLPKGCDLKIEIENLFYDKNIDVIFDVGANTGQSLHYFKKIFPKAKIYSFEPVASTFEILKRESEKFKNVTVENIGFGNKENNMSIVIEKNSQQNSFVVTENDKNKKTENVFIRTIDSYCHEKSITKINLLKIDTEGFDLKVLNGAESLLKSNSIDLIYVEIGLYKDELRHSYLPDLIDYLIQFGYFFQSIHDYKQYFAESWGNALFIHESLLRKY